jgi:hypothetical protein
VTHTTRAEHSLQFCDIVPRSDSSGWGFFIV